MPKICPECGTTNFDEANFCEKCGNDLRGVEAPKPKVKTEGGLKEWWNKRSTNEKIISGLAACCIGVFLFVLVIGILAPEPTALSVSNVNAQIDDKTTEYIIKGTTEPNAKVYITAASLNINRVEATVDNKTGNFEYKLTIPINITDLNVEVRAAAPEKLGVSQAVNIQRPLTPLSIKPTPKLTEEKTVTIEGTTDPQADVRVSSSELKINEAKINVDSKGNFKYTVNVPSDISSASVSITAKSIGKKINTQSESIVRESTPPPAPGIQIKVSCSGSWSGAYGDETGTQSIDGSGTQTIPISGSPSVVSATFQKMSGGHGTLTVEIIEDGTVVESKSTSAAYGVVSVVHSFF